MHIFVGRSTFSDRLERNTRARRNEVGRVLKGARRRMGFRQAWVAWALGYGESSQAEMSRIEAGRRKIEVIELENFAHLYGLKLSDFETWNTQQEADRAQYAYAPGQGYGLGEGLDDDEF